MIDQVIQASVQELKGRNMKLFCDIKYGHEFVILKLDNFDRIKRVKIINSQKESSSQASEAWQPIYAIFNQFRKASSCFAQ